MVFGGNSVVFGVNIVVVGAYTVVFWVKYSVGCGIYRGILDNHTGIWGQIHWYLGLIQ